jgi:hypothetical protein
MDTNTDHLHTGTGLWRLARQSEGAGKGLDILAETQLSGGTAAIRAS